MRIEIINPREVVDRTQQRTRRTKPGPTRRTDLLMTRRFHSWLLRFGEPGERDEMHCHNEDETFVCIEGECTMSFPDGGKGVLKPGMAALIPGGLFYQLENTGSGELILMGSRSGARETTKNIPYEDKVKRRAALAAKTRGKDPDSR